MLWHHLLSCLFNSFSYLKPQINGNRDPSSVAVSCSKNQGGLRGGARFRRPSVVRPCHRNPSPVSRTKPSRPTTAHQLTVWVKLLRSKVLLYAMTSIILSMLQAMISIIHSPTACFGTSSACENQCPLSSVGQSQVKVYSSQRQESHVQRRRVTGAGAGARGCGPHHPPVSRKSPAREDRKSVV